MRLLAPANPRSCAFRSLSLRSADKKSSFLYLDCIFTIIGFGFFTSVLFLTAILVTKSISVLKLIGKLQRSDSV